jgi:hypothetical protein
VSVGPALAHCARLARCRSLDALREVLGDDNAALNELQTLFTLAEAYGYADWLVFDASVVRGLAYYTGTVFEAFDREGVLRAICGGGRYDKLMSAFGTCALPATIISSSATSAAPSSNTQAMVAHCCLCMDACCTVRRGTLRAASYTLRTDGTGGRAWERAGGADQPMVGFGFGDAVIVELLKERGLMPQLSASVQDVVIALGGPDMQVAATSVAAQLRAQVQNRWLLFQLRRFAAALHGLGPVRLLLGCHSLTAVPHAAGALRGSSDRVQEDEVGVQACGALGRRSPGTHQSARPDRVGGQPPRSQPAEQQPG